MHIRKAIASATILGALLGPAVAQTWPMEKPIKLIVPFPPGSAIESIARPVFEQVGKQINQTFVFESRAGAGGTLAMTQVAKADPDGYTLLLSSSIHTIVPQTYSNLSFDPAKDFAAVIPLGQFPNVLVAPPGRFKNVQDLVAKAKAKPGSITYGSGGVGAATHLNAERFRLAAGFEGVHVPFKGPQGAMNEVLGGRIDFYFAPVPSAVGLVQSKALDALAVSSLKRDDALPNVPTTLEAGYPESDFRFWIGVFAPAGVPKEIVQRLHTEIEKALNIPAIKEAVGKLGADPMPMTPSDFEAFLKSETASNAVLVKAAGIKPN